jgi:hypothetical protein
LRRMHSLVAPEGGPITNAWDGDGWRWWGSSRPKDVEPVPSTARLVLVASACHIA